MKDFDFKDQLEEVIFSWYGNDPTNAMNELKYKMALQYTNFVAKATPVKSSNSICYQILENGSKTIHQYWLVDGAQWSALQKLALWMFSMATSSTASEQAFSSFGFIHSKLRNRLGNNNVEKLVYIKKNHVSFSELDHDSRNQVACSADEISN